MKTLLRSGVSEHSVKYFECHITIDPQFGPELARFEEAVTKHGFKVAKLFKANGTSSDRDSFCTAHDSTLDAIKAKMIACEESIRDLGINVRRAKIEAIVYDTRFMIPPSPA